VGQLVGCKLWEAMSKRSLHVSSLQFRFSVRILTVDMWSIANFDPSSLEEFIDNFIVNRCIVSVRPLFFPYRILLSFHSSLVYVPTILALCWQSFSTTSHICTLQFSYLHLPRTAFSSHDSSPSLLFHIFLCCYLIVTCCCHLVCRINTIVKLGLSYPDVHLSPGIDKFITQ
jgi:hypothetical protein